MGLKLHPRKTNECHPNRGTNISIGNTSEQPLIFRGQPLVFWGVTVLPTCKMDGFPIGIPIFQRSIFRCYVCVREGKSSIHGWLEDEFPLVAWRQFSGANMLVSGRIIWKQNDRFMTNVHVIVSCQHLPRGSVWIQGMVYGHPLSSIQHPLEDPGVCEGCRFGPESSRQTPGFTII